MTDKNHSADEDKIIVSPPRPGKATFVLTESSWLIYLDEISCAKLRGTDGILTDFLLR